MEKIIHENNNYFIGENGIYMEMQNIKIYKDTDRAENKRHYTYCDKGDISQK